MESISNQSPLQGARLKIEYLKNLSGIIHSLESGPSFTPQIKVIEVDENEVDESESDAAVDPPERGSEIYEKFGIEMSKIIQEIQHHGGLEAFKWIGVDEENTRPAVFWESLWKTASTLENLNIQFSVHELEKLSKLVSHPQILLHTVLTRVAQTLPSVQFPVLETLSINASAAHGDNGSLVEAILQTCPALQDLDLSFPTCDLEGCRLQGITWQHTFPSLKALDVRTYNSDNAALSEFLLRHPKIATLAWDVDADEGFIFPRDSLPELRALSMDFRGRSELLKENVEVLARCQHLAHLRVDGCPHTSYLEIAKLGNNLKCLELNPGVYSWREGCGESGEEPDSDDEKLADSLEAETGMRNLPSIIGSMLEKLYGLQELAMDLETSCTSSRNDEGKFVNPDSMNVKDLVSRFSITPLTKTPSECSPLIYKLQRSIIKVLPKDTQIRALRLSDQRGLTLPEEVLENFPEVPASLEYLKWCIGETGLLYKLERNGGRVRAVECEALRRPHGRENWVEERVLEY
jgi:hypothetical protein